MLTIRQTENGWEILRDDVVLTVTVEGVETSTFARYEDAVAVLATMIDVAASLAVGDGTEVEGETSTDGLLPETWESPADGGICFSAPTGDGRDFTNCTWTWRDPGVSTVPLMLQTSTEMAHFGASLAGFVTEFFENNGTPGARGRFFDTETGRQFRDMLLSDRRFGVSVDPGAVAYEEECLEVDDDGWCSRWQLNFLDYQIIGVTGTPFPGFENASVGLGAPATVAASAAPASCGCADPSACACHATGGIVPSFSLMRIGERGVETFIPDARGRIVPHPVTAGAATMPALDIPLAPPPRFFEDPDFLMPTPLTITDQHRVMGHVESGGCHTGYPPPHACVDPPRGCDFQDFLQGRVETSDGQIIRTGVLAWGMDHPDHELSFFEAMALYANSAAGWADVVIGYDSHGTWVSGVLRPGLTEADVRILRALSLSGDWRTSRRTGRHELIGVLAVNYPGYPILASAGRHIAAPRPTHRPDVITAAGMIPQRARREPTEDLIARVSELERRLAKPFRDELRGHRRDLAAARLRG